MTSNGKRRRVAAACDSCMDDPEKECHECGCRACAGKQDEHSLLLCDECNDAYHLGCLDPPLAEIPEEDYWYCPKCKNDENEIVKVGARFRSSPATRVAISSSLLTITFRCRRVTKSRRHNLRKRTGAATRRETGEAEWAAWESRKTAASCLRIIAVRSRGWKLACAGCTECR